jgi:Na+-transporting NADH:ubiquinone oxidoreductase subunit C
MLILAAAFGAVVSSVAVATRSRVEAGERARFRGHVLSACGIDAPTDPEALRDVWQRLVEQQGAEPEVFYAVRNPDGSSRGYAFPFQGAGFWGPIRGVVAVDPLGKEILGISFPSHQETPGLGGRITEKWFRDQFRGKPVSAPPGEAAVLKLVPRTPRGPREVEAITGATETSTRLSRFLNEFLEGLRDRPVLRQGRGT